MSNKTTLVDPKTVECKWFVVDADGQILGRLASRVAFILRGKHKPQWSPNVDIGDHVIVINAEKVVLTGKKLVQKFHYRHSGYPGNLKRFNYRWMMENQPDKVLMMAVERMLPKNRLGRQMIKKLRVYRGPNHPHQAQQPIPLDLAKVK